MPKRWIFHSFDTGLANSVAVSARIDYLVAALLVARGIRTPEAARSFLDADFKTGFRRPGQLPGCDAVARCLAKAVREKKSIAIYGDYDVDGITATAILHKTLKRIGAKRLSYYIPSRIDEGYGLSIEAMDRLKTEDGIDVIVTVDCGITSLDEAEHARRLGIDLLITDHHNPGPVLPAALAIAHPQLVRYPADGEIVSPASLTKEQWIEAKKYPFPALCGAGVALKVALRLGEIVGREEEKPALSSPLIRELIVLATLGTVADYVALLDENRALVRKGLEILDHSSISTGLDLLLQYSKYTRGKTSLNEEFISFQLVPRLNAAGRLEQASLAAELLIGENRQRLEELAAYIDQLNRTRKKLQDQLVREASQQAGEYEDDAAWVLAGDGWQKGIIGIVAGKLAERFHRPVVLLARDKMGIDMTSVGSARSIPGFNLYAALAECEELFVRFGGHDAAAGLTIENDKIDLFRERFCETVGRRLSEAERKAEIFIDGVFALGAFTPQTVRQVLSLAPFGNENARPVFAAERVVVENVKAMGDGSHFSADFLQGAARFRGIAFHRKEWIETMRPYDKPMDIAFNVRFGSFSGKVELDILDWRREECPGE